MKFGFIVLFVLLCFACVITICLPLILCETTTTFDSFNQHFFGSNNQRFAITKEPTIIKSGNFQNVIYYCPKIAPRTFQQMIAIESDSKKIIASSNSYLTDKPLIHSFNHEYEKRYGVYGGLLNAYEIVKTKPIDEHIVDRTIMISNSFTGTNSGHDLGTLLSSLIYIEKNGLQQYQSGIQELAFKFPRILEILELFTTNWIIIEFEKSYYFKSVDFLEVSPRFIVEEYKKPEVISLIEKIKMKSKFYMISQGGLPPINTKIILLKQSQNTSARTHDAFHGAHFFTRMNDEEWIILNPEFNDMRYMICLLSTASRIVISFGAIMWTHMLFFNPEAKVIHLQIDTEIAYKPVSEMKYFSRILMHNLDLDSPANKDLISKINSF